MEIGLPRQLEWNGVRKKKTLQGHSSRALPLLTVSTLAFSRHSTAYDVFFLECMHVFQTLVLSAWSPPTVPLFPSTSHWDPTSSNHFFAPFSILWNPHLVVFQRLPCCVLEMLPPSPGEAFRFYLHLHREYAGSVRITIKETLPWHLLHFAAAPHLSTRICRSVAWFLVRSDCHS